MAKVKVLNMDGEEIELTEIKSSKQKKYIRARDYRSTLEALRSFVKRGMITKTDAYIYMVLLARSRHGELTFLSWSELAREVGVAYDTLKRSWERLEAADLLIRQPSPKNVYCYRVVYYTRNRLPGTLKERRRRYMQKLESMTNTVLTNARAIHNEAQLDDDPNRREFFRGSSISFICGALQNLHAKLAEAFRFKTFARQNPFVYALFWEIWRRLRDPKSAFLLVTCYLFSVFHPRFKRTYLYALRVLRGNPVPRFAFWAKHIHESIEIASKQTDRDWKAYLRKILGVDTNEEVYAEFQQAVLALRSQSLEYRRHRLKQLAE